MDSSLDTKHNTDTSGTKKAKAEVRRPSSHPPQSKNPLTFWLLTQITALYQLYAFKIQLQKVQVDVAGVPTEELVDTGADITITGPDFTRKLKL